jgi:hypothetical protein
MYLSRGRALVLLVVTVAALVGARFTFAGPDPASVIEDINARLVAPCFLTDDGRGVHARVHVTSRTTEATQVVLRLAVTSKGGTEAVWKDVPLPAGSHEQSVVVRGTLDKPRPNGRCLLGVDY